MTVGDIVVLNSGGPDMTVSRIEGRCVLCWWVCGDDTDSGWFGMASLTPQ